MNYNSSVLVSVDPALGGDGVGLVRGIACIYVAVLEDNSGISEYEIDSPVDVTFSVELPVGMGIESVLVTFEAAFVEHREIRA